MLAPDDAPKGRNTNSRASLAFAAEEKIYRAFDLAGRARGGMGCPCAEWSIRLCNRFKRVSSFLALTTQYAAVLRYQAGWT